LRVAERQKHWHLVLDRMTSYLAVGSVCVSRGVQRFSYEVARLDPDRLTVIPNGIDTALFDAARPVPRVALGISESAHLALFVGRLDPQKGLPELLSAAEQVIGQRPNWHLALAGDGPCRDWLLEQLVHRIALRGKVQWLGQRDDIPSLLKAADVLVHASLWEGMPNSVLEAMAAGRPVIGTYVEGTEDLVIPGQTGWLVPPRDITALSHALLAATDSAERLERYGKAGRFRVEQEFSLEATVSAYEQLWATVLGFRLPAHNVTQPNS
jgi:starch synthase (maltosyl-transferring)